MAEAKVFPMSTFVAVLRGVDMDKQKKGVGEFATFVTGQNVDADFSPFALALSKAWVYEQNPELATMGAAEMTGLGAKVALKPLADDAAAEAAGIFEKLAGFKATIADQAAKIADLEAKLAEATAKLTVAESKVKTFEAQQKAGDQKLEVSSKKLDDYSKKLEALLAQIDEVKSKGVVVAGVAGAAAGAAAGEAGGDAAGPVDSGPSDDFGFGSDAFNADSW